jgi:hypothetical protein
MDRLSGGGVESALGEMLTSADDAGLEPCDLKR